jgi:hypothetical protein
MTSTKTKAPKAKTSLDPAIERELSIVKSATTTLPARIIDEATYTRIQVVQKTTHALIKTIESWYDKTLKPLNTAISAIRAEKKAVLLEPLAWEDAAERLLADYYAKKEEAAQKERAALQRRLDAEAEAARKKELLALKRNGDKEGAQALALAPVVAAQAEVQNEAKLNDRSFRDDIEITILDLDAVPVEYVSRDIRIAVIKAAWKNGVRDIPGLSIRPVKTLVNRGA